MPAAEPPRRWSTVDDLIAVVRRRWESGRYLVEYASGAPFTSVSLPVTAPKADELLHRLTEATRWLTQFERASTNTNGTARFTVEYRTISSRTVGANRVPARITIDSLAQLCDLLDVADDVRALDDVIRITTDRLPAVLPWVVGHPSTAIAHRTHWADVLATVAWITDNEPARHFLRHIDIDGVDTKFVELNRHLISDLLSDVLPPERVSPTSPRHDLIARFGFRAKPSYTRFRLLSPDAEFPAAVSELTLRTNELAGLHPSATTVFIVENEISYLAFPDVPGSIVVFGGGFAIDIVKALDWLDDKAVVYWGDIDTHGLAMLSRLRARFPHVRSMLMDHATLAAHPRQWVTEPSQTTALLAHLTDEESAVYRDLIEDRYGPSVRLEQERVRFSLVRAAVEAWTG